MSLRHNLSIAETVSEAENAYDLATWLSESSELLKSFKIKATTPSSAKKNNILLKYEK